ncbi:MAG TPA: MoaD/ThiS family protein [Gemmatimonadales bacterium]|jgi:molybdopterin converting factor small subunit|nr:MoaD/ThiS family protein [Gemmatimonadales bacterium]
MTKTETALPLITVRVQLFASYAEALGADTLDLSLEEPATVGDALLRIRALPGGDRVPPHPLCAVNLSQVSPSAALEPGDELALLPPLSGG